MYFREAFFNFTYLSYYHISLHELVSKRVSQYWSISASIFMPFFLLIFSFLSSFISSFLLLLLPAFPSILSVVLQLVYVNQIFLQSTSFVLFYIVLMFLSCKWHSCLVSDITIMSSFLQYELIAYVLQINVIISSSSSSSSS